MSSRTGGQPRRAGEFPPPPEPLTVAVVDSHTHLDITVTEGAGRDVDDLIDAAAAADVIGVPLEAVNFSAEYKERVFAEFLREYSAGRTPNPDVLCNAEIKFKSFLDHAMRLGAQKIATGHYARVRAHGDAVQLLKGLDPLKDQSYFLHMPGEPELSRLLLPLGESTKEEARAEARAESRAESCAELASVRIGFANWQKAAFSDHRAISLSAPR